MIDPERLLEADLQDATSLRERELLGSLKPSGNVQTAVWRQVVGQGVLVVGAAATTATAAATASAANATAVSVEVVAASTATGASTVATTTGVMSSLAAKAGVVLIVAAPVLSGTVYLTRGAPQRDEPAAMAPKPTAPNGSVQKRNAVTEPQRAEVAVVPAPDPTKLETNSAPSPTNADALREENRLLREARSLERAGNPGQALRILNDLDRLFARGALLQEREILRLQSLSATGSAAAAKTRAEQFLKRYPASPYAAHVRSILDGSSPSP